MGILFFVREEWGVQYLNTADTTRLPMQGFDLIILTAVVVDSRWVSILAKAVPVP